MYSIILRLALCIKCLISPVGAPIEHDFSLREIFQAARVLQIDTYQNFSDEEYEWYYMSYSETIDWYRANYENIRNAPSIEVIKQKLPKNDYFINCQREADRFISTLENRSSVWPNYIENQMLEEAKSATHRLINIHEIGGAITHSGYYGNGWRRQQYLRYIELWGRDNTEIGILPPPVPMQYVPYKTRNIND